MMMCLFALLTDIAVRQSAKTFWILSCLHSCVQNPYASVAEDLTKNHALKPNAVDPKIIVSETDLQGSWENLLMENFTQRSAPLALK